MGKENRSKNLKVTSVVKSTDVLVPSTNNIGKCVAAVVMVKDETKRICVTLSSCLPVISRVIILDTGSTDGTQDLIREWCTTHKKELFMKEVVIKKEDFAFDVARNIMLDFADDKCDWAILLDSNDEVKNSIELHRFIQSYSGIASGFYCTQEWYNGTDSTDRYFNVKLIRTKHGWRYNDEVHEYIDTIEENKKEIIRLEMFTFYQDRVEDNHKSIPRFTRDRLILQRRFDLDPTQSRTCFYLAQTLSCLGEKENAYKMYKKRLSLGGFEEEIFHSYLRLGDLAFSLGHDPEEFIMWFMKAFEHSKRAEPLTKIAEWYRDKNWTLSYMFIQQACQLDYPHEAILFVDKSVYSYKRWHLMGIISYYAGRFQEGKVACLKALEFQKTDVDASNLQHYENKLREIESSSKLQEMKNRREKNKRK